MFGMLQSVVLFVLVVGVKGSFMDGYIMQVTPGCGATSSDDANIEIRTDMDVYAIALCNNSESTANRKFAKTQNGVLLTKAVKTSGATGPECEFTKKDNSDTYTIIIKISFGDRDTSVHKKHTQYLITCTYDDNDLDVAESSSRSITEPYLQPYEIQRNQGSPTGDTITLDTVDVLGFSISGDIPIGKKIQLKATLTGSSAGLQVVSCRIYCAVRSYSILRGGCGDGVAFPKDQGFTTTGKVAVSPYFEAFELTGASSVLFECNFTTCTTNCDGGSCGAARRRRSADEIDSVESQSPQLSVKSERCYKFETKTDEESGIVLLAPASSYKAQAPPNSYTESSSMTMVLVVVAAVMMIILGVCIAGISMIGLKRRRDETLLVN